jgi:DNA-binding HxlR family transcriptional regulator
MLIQQLKELIHNGWIIRKDYNTIPPKTEYSLTDLGISFMPILETIYDWGTANNITGIVQKESF